MEIQRNRQAFEHVRNQIGSCGIWCGSCAVGNGCVAELAAGLRELLAAYDTPEWASLETAWEPFMDALGSIKQSISCTGCRGGGGRDKCEIRACAQGRGLMYCTDCSSFGDCEHSAILEHMRSGAVKVGLSVLSPGEIPDSAIGARNRTLRRRWPGCVLFAEDA